MDLDGERGVTFLYIENPKNTDNQCVFMVVPGLNKLSIRTEDNTNIDGGTDTTGNCMNFQALDANGAAIASSHNINQDTTHQFDFTMRLVTCSVARGTAATTCADINTVIETAFDSAMAGCIDEAGMDRSTVSRTMCRAVDGGNFTHYDVNASSTVTVAAAPQRSNALIKHELVSVHTANDVVCQDSFKFSSSYDPTDTQRNILDAAFNFNGVVSGAENKVYLETYDFTIGRGREEEVSFKPTLNYS